MKCKRLILVIVFAAHCVLMYAQQVNYNVAKNIAESFIAVKKGNMQKSNSAVSHEHTVYGETGIPLFFIFNFEGGGFVIVSANKNAEPVLAYSTTNAFLMGGVNPAAENWINGYAQGISYAIETHAVPTPETASRWNDAEKGNFKIQKAAIVEPLLTSKWNQDRYYNALCPDTIQSPAMAAYDDRTPNGCVALAMAQIMYYHRYPRKGAGASTYVCTGYGQQRADYANANYNYEAMSDVATGYSHAIAQLCYHAGVSVRMNYKASGSGALSEDARTALASRFIYKSSLELHSRGNDQAWKNLLKNDLNKGLPVYYSACNRNMQGVHSCHAFVCDGYDDNDFFHFNWGWGGSGDGFYAINDMMGYTTRNQIITGIEPMTETIKSTGADTLTATFGSFSDGSSPRVNYANNTNRSWLISPQNGKNITRITLSTSYFSTYSNDIVTIYSGNTANPASQIAALSGNLDTIIRIQASEVFVTFTGSSAAKGFKFTYTSNMTSDNLCPTSATILTASNEPTGTITVDATNKYDASNECLWALRPEGAQHVGITFTKFDLEEGDFVELNRWNATGSLLNVKYWTLNNINFRFTKGNPPVLNREYSVQDAGALIRFRTDNNLNGTGFTLHWRAIDNVGVNEVQAGIEKMSIYPNPASDKVKIQIETLQPETVQISLYDIVGRKLFHSSNSEATQQTVYDIDVSHLAKGIYMLQIATSKGQVMRKVVIR